MRPSSTKRDQQWEAKRRRYLAIKQGHQPQAQQQEATPDRSHLFGTSTSPALSARPGTTGSASLRDEILTQRLQQQQPALQATPHRPRGVVPGTHSNSNAAWPHSPTTPQEPYATTAAQPQAAQAAEAVYTSESVVEHTGVPPGMPRMRAAVPWATDGTPERPRQQGAVRGRHLLQSGLDTSPGTPHAAPRTPHAAPRTPHVAPRSPHVARRPPGTAASTASVKSQYLLDLEQQMREKKARQAAEREQEAAEDARIMRQRSVMDRFGDNSGGGAPIKSSDGRVITDLRDLGKDLATYKTASPHASQDQGPPWGTPRTPGTPSGGGAGGGAGMRGRRQGNGSPMAHHDGRLDGASMLVPAHTPGRDNNHLPPRRASLAKLEPLHHSPTPDAGAMLMARASGGGGDRIGVHDASGVFQVLTAKQVEAIIAENEMLKAELRYLKVHTAGMQEELAQYKQQPGGGVGAAAAGGGGRFLR